MAVYPFYVEATAEGRRSPICGGTRKKDGDMTIEVKQRDKGAITTPYKIRQWSALDVETNILKLHTTVYYQGEVISDHVTDY